MPSGRARNLRPLVIPFAAFLAILPLILHGCSCGHDFDFHLLSWIEAATQYAHGNLHPQWAFTPAWNAGEPRFVFYPPVSWTLGAAIGLVLAHLPRLPEGAAWTVTPMLFTWTALTASGLTLYRLAREFASANAALVAAVLYVANPYMLFTAYERTAYAELLSAAWIPLLLLAILRRRPTITGIALPVALLWLTNAPAAVMGTYTLAFLTLVRLASMPGTSSENSRRATLRFALTSASGTALGIAIAAFFLLPAAVERRYIQMSMAFIEGMRIDHNFLFEHTGTTPDAFLHDAVLHTASTIAVLLLAATFLALTVAFLLPQDSETQPSPRRALAALAIGIAFMLTPLSLPFWTYLPEASLLQFPWRILAILGAVLALSIALGYDSVAARPAQTTSPARTRTSALAAVTVTITAALIAAAYPRFRQRCDSEDNPAARLALFHSHYGTDPTDEYTPARLDNDALSHSNPPWWIAPHPNDDAPLAQPGPAPSKLSVTAPSPAFLILDRRDFPTWRVLRNGKPVSHLRRPDGLIAVPIPQGPSTVDILPEHPADQIAGDAISASAILLFGFLKLRRRSR